MSSQLIVKVIRHDHQTNPLERTIVMRCVHGFVVGTCDLCRPLEAPTLSTGDALPDAGAVIDGLQGTIAWIQSKDRNATNWLYLTQAISLLEAARVKADAPTGMVERVAKAMKALRTDHLPTVEELARCAVETIQAAPIAGELEGLEQIISAWAFAHNIDGAARNDLFARLSGKHGD